ncbi:TetR/AcrR family transcriptional regulator [Kineosporia sp. NBRC 101731]|uniref:TetR/AcrR family transcriptional regulator n=1 Tax=Kineosporia sp. NBRC 101731 TaxID=3032199 RepID=UPI0025553643|nr:TetR/AcrR family transcriptional regulator [Kineosporia sp. NBRC 101731]
MDATVRATSPGDTPRSRLLAAALALYSRHGVNGTSLQMIADRLGVTKAAVYHQFRSKDAILLALLEPLVNDMRDVVERAERERTRTAQVESVLTGVIDLAVRHREVSALMQADPAVQALHASQSDSGVLSERIGQLLLGPDPEPGRLISVAMLGSALMMTGKNPKLAAVEDEELRQQMLVAARRLLGLRSRG